MSYEKSNVFAPLFSKANTNLQNLVRNLGPTIFRIGGTSVDDTTWQDFGPGLNSAGNAVSQADIVRLKSFLQGADARVIYGLPLKAQDFPKIAQEALYAAQILGPSLYGFSLGNEANFYALPVDRLIQLFQRGISAIRSSVPAARIVGPDLAYVAGGTQQIAAALGSQIDLVTTHYYIGPANRASNIQLLYPDGYLTYTVQTLQSYASKALLGSRVSEAGNFYGGGALGYSNTLASALWAIDAAFGTALAGGGGINFQGGNNIPGSYTPIADNGTSVTEIRPAYYGILFFAQFANGTLTTRNFSTDPLFTTYMVQKNDGRIFLALINKHSQKRSGSFNVGRPIRGGNVYYLAAPSLASERGVTLGDAAVAINGTWKPVARPLQFAATAAPNVPNFGGWNINMGYIPPYTAVLLEIF